jgi:hypothetical protein
VAKFASKADSALQKMSSRDPFAKGYSYERKNIGEFVIGSVKPTYPIGLNAVVGWLQFGVLLHMLFDANPPYPLCPGYNLTTHHCRVQWRNPAYGWLPMEFGRTGEAFLYKYVPIRQAIR